MLVKKPGWVNHDGASIFSVDVHPFLQKFVTSGQSDNGGGLVIIWNLRPLLNEKMAEDKNQHKSLLRLEFAGCVNCVRWSKSGIMFACGGDEQLITIWQYMGKLNSAGAIGQKSTNVEQWKCIHKLRYHTGDVLHVDWSPDDKYLASCGIDNKVIIWDGNKLPEKIQVLDVHTDQVKGLAWDPMGRYLATQSADKTLKIWAANIWQCVKTISKPFEECGNTTTTTRPDWSPDGSILISAQAMNNNGPCALIIKRTDWEHDRDLVGHRKAVSCVRWGPKIFASKSSDKKSPSSGALVALGSRDRTVTVWQLPKVYGRPIAAVKDLFKQTIMDMAWTANGLNLLACSFDGSVACFMFTPDELGRSWTDAEFHNHLAKRYGSVPKSLLSNGDISVNTDSALVDSAAVLLARKEYEEKKDTTITPTVTPVKSQPTQPPVTPIAAQSTKQIEMRTPDGRRRIQPLFLGSVSVPEPTNSANEQSEGITASDAVIAASSIETEREEKTNIAQESSASDYSTNDNKSTEPNSTSENVAVPLLSPQRKKKEKKNKEGKMKESQLKRKHQLTVDEPKKKRGRKRKEPSEPDLDRLTEIPSVSERPSSRETQPSAKTIVVDHSRPILPIPERQKTLKMDINEIGLISAKCNALVENEVFAGTGVFYSRLTVSRGIEKLWTIMLGIRPELLAASRDIVSVSCVNCTVHVFDAQTGYRLTSPFRLSDSASILLCSDRFCMVITSRANCSVWCFKENNPKAVLSEKSFACLLDDKVTVENSNLTDTGLPLVQLTNGETFVYSVDCQSWQLINDQNDPLNKISHRLKIPRSQSPLGPLTKIMNTNKSSTATVKCSGFVSSNAADALLELNCQAALSIKSAKEFRYWLHQWTHRLITNGSFHKLRELCRQLLGPVHRAPRENEQKILGLSKRNLLKEILPLIAGNSNLQRLYTEFHEALSNADLDVI